MQIKELLGAALIPSAASRGAFAAILGAVVLVASAAPTLADDKPAPGASGAAARAGTSDALMSPDLMRRQIPLMDLKGWIIKQAGIEESGYIESINDSARMSTTLLWHGPENALQRAIVAEGKSRGISVSIRQRKHSRAKILAAARAAHASAGKGVFAGYKITSVATLNPDVDGIVVRGEHLNVSLADQAAADSALAGAAAEQLGVDVSVGPGSRYVPYATRSNDNPPFNAGGYMISPSTGATCSTGFGIWLSGVARTTTAQHCNFNDFRARDGSYTYGTSIAVSSGQGRVLSAGGYYKMFDGGHSDPNGFAKTVVDYGHVSINDTVCTSGGNSGVHCDLGIVEMCHMFDDGYSFECTIRGLQRTGGIAAATGDSGGPVFVPIGGMQVRAAGMIQGGRVLWHWHVCNAHDNTVETECGDDVLFSAMWTITQTLGATLRTG